MHSNTLYSVLFLTNVARRVMLMALVAITLIPVAHAGEVKRRPLESGIMALGKDGRTLGLEVQLSQHQRPSSALTPYLLQAKESAAYKNRATSFVPFERLNPQAQRKVLLTIFEKDVVDASGWHHTAIFSGETLWTLCTWLTGEGSRSKDVMALAENKVSGTLRKGQTVRIPLSLLRPALKSPTRSVLTPIQAPKVKIVPAAPKAVAKVTVVPKTKTIPTVAVVAPQKIEVKPAVLSVQHPDLEYARDAQGAYAGYTLKKGETLYSAVVMRFTDYRKHDDVTRACTELARRSAIKNTRDIDAGMQIRIPVDMLSGKFRPAATVPRVATVPKVAKVTPQKSPAKPAQKVAKASPKKPLSDIVVILDPGHGGKDHGAYYKRSGLYEDEINYDVVMRIKALLEKDTGAKVYLTLIDKSSGNAYNDRTSFSHDQDEVLLTTPRHNNNIDAKFSANLRWMLVNKIYDTERKRGVPARKIIFASIHTESVNNTSHRGTKVFIPGGQYRRANYPYSRSSYSKYTEGRGSNYSSTSSERKSDEALSRNFANVFMDELGKHRIKRNDGGHAIRGEIRTSKTRVFVPAVLNYNKVPTKILVEMANLQNPTDRQRLADPWWRQEYAKAYVAALKRFYSVSSSKTSVAKARK